MTESQTTVLEKTDRDGVDRPNRWRSATRLFLALLIFAVVVAGWLGARYARGRAITAIRESVVRIAHDAGMTITLDRVRLDGFHKVSVTGISLCLDKGGGATDPIAVIPELDAETNLVMAFLGRPVPVALKVVNPRLKVVRQADGTWAAPSFTGSRGDSGAFQLNNMYSLVVNVESGQLDVREEKSGLSLTAQDVNLTLRSSADKQSFRIEGTCLTPHYSGHPITVEGSIYPAERTFSFATTLTGLKVDAATEFLGDAIRRPHGGIVDATADLRGVMGKETSVQSTVAFSGLDMASEPAFLHNVSGTADVAVAVNHETREVTINSPEFNTTFCHGSLSGTVAYGADQPTTNIRALFDRFPIEELVKLVTENTFDGVSDLNFTVEKQGELTAEVRGTLTEPKLSCAMSTPASHVGFIATTDRYGPVTASVDLGETSVHWDTTKGVSGDAEVIGGSFAGDQMPVSVSNLAGHVSFRNGLVRTESIRAVLDEVPVSVSGYAKLSGSEIQASEASFRCAIDDLSENKYVKKLNKLGFSGRTELTGTVFKLGDSVLWSLDSDLTNAEVTAGNVFRKPAGTAARFHADGSPYLGKPFNVGIAVALDGSTVQGYATVDPSRSPAITSVNLQSDEFRLAKVLSLLDLPVEAHDDAGTKLTFFWNAESGKRDVTANLSSDHVTFALAEEQNRKPILFDFDEFRLSVTDERDGYVADLKANRTSLTPPVIDLVKEGYRLKFLRRLTVPVRMSADIGEFVSEPYHVKRLQCQILASRPQLKLASATGQTAGGTFQLQSDILRNDRVFSLEYSCEGFDIGQMLVQVSEVSDRVSGRLSATLSLSGSIGSSNSTSGQGTLTVTDGKIDSSYVMSWMRGLEEERAPNPIQFDRLRCDFSLDNDTVNVSNLRFEKPGLVLRGQGSIMLDGHVDQTFDVDMSRQVAEQLSVRKRWGLIDLFPLPGITTGPITRTFRVKGTLGKLKAEVEKRPLHVEIVRGTMAFSEGIVVAGVTVLALPARMFMDILTLVPAPENHNDRG